MHPLFFFLLSAAIIVANSTQLEPSQKNRNSYSLPYNLQPHDFPNEQLYHAYVVIQRFKNTISCDPKNITTTWIGQDVCGEKSYSGFYCTTPSRHGENLTLTAVDFNGFGLCAPKLQGFIDQLPDLAIFQATSNNFTGDIPRLSGLPEKYSLEVKDDFESSKQNEEFFGLKHCTSASFNGANVKVLCRMYNPSVLQKAVVVSGATNAKALLLSNNKLSGALLANLGFSKLSYLALANDMLTV